MMIKKVVILGLSLLSLLGPRQAKAEVVSLTATCELKDNLTICFVSTKNMGSQVLHINPNHFSLITDDGISHPYNIETYSDHGYFLSKDLSKEEELKGKLVFEVFGKPEYLVFDNGAGVKAKVSLTREPLEGKEVEPIEPPKMEERKELALLAEVQPEGIYQKEVEDLKKTLSEKDAELAFLKESLKELEDKLSEVMKEEKEETQRLKTALEEQNLRLNVEVEDLKKTLSEKDAELAFLKESLKELEDKLSEVMKEEKEEKEEAERLRTALEEQNLRLKEKEELLSKCQEDKAIKEELLSKYQWEKEKGPDKKSKLIPFIFLAGAVALIVSAK